MLLKVIDNNSRFWENPLFVWDFASLLGGHVIKCNFPYVKTFISKTMMPTKQGISKHPFSFLMFSPYDICRPTNEYRIEIMYVYYITMETYIFVCTNIVSFFYFLCVTITPHHSSTMYFTHS